MSPVAPPRSRPALAVAGLLAALAGACGARSGLGLLPTEDPGVHVVPTDAASDAAAPPDSAPPDAGCGASGAAQVLATFGTGLTGPTLFAMAVGAGSAYVEASRSGNPYGIYKVPLSGGAPQVVIQGRTDCPSQSPFWAESPLATDGVSLFMISGDLTADCHGSSPTISTYDLASGALGSVSPPAGTAAFNIMDVRAASGRGAYYVTGSEYDPSTSDLVRWDGTTATVVATLPEWCDGLLLAGDTVFTIGAHAIYTLPITGGAATAIATVTFATGADLLAANATSLFYTTDGVTILRRTIATGETAPLATPATRAYLSSATSWADDAYLYFGDNGTESGLLRVAVAGGPIEAFWPATRKIVAGVTLGCHVYWIADADFPHGLPPELVVAAE